MYRGPILCFVALLVVPNGAWAQGEPLGPEFRINSDTTGGGSPAVASDSSGNFVVVWTSQDGSYSGVFARRYASTGEPLGPEFRVNTYTTDSQEDPAVASESSGNFVVVWESSGQDGSGRGIFGQRYGSSGQPLGPEFQVNTHTTGSQGGDYSKQLAVASDSSGDLVVVWGSDMQDGSDLGVFGQRYHSSGVPLGPEFRVNTYTTSSQDRPAVASDSSGNFVVVWASFQEGPTGKSGVFGQSFASSGVPLGRQFHVNTYTTDNQLEPAVASDSSGNFVVVWRDNKQDGSGVGVFGKRCCSSTGKLAPEFRVNTYTTNDQIAPAVASDSSGNFVVVWNSVLQDGSIWGVFAQRYDRSGEPLGAEFRVNTHTTDSQDSSAVASDSSGNFVVVWRSIENYQGGIFGQRFGTIAPSFKAE